MTPEILAFLKNESTDAPSNTSTKLLEFVRHWRDRLQTDVSRESLTDSLTLENTTTITDQSVTDALSAWATTALNEWFAFANVIDLTTLNDKILESLTNDTLTGWAGAHDAVGACGITSYSDLFGDNATKEHCFSAARINAPIATETTDAEGNKTTTYIVKNYEDTVANIQLSLKTVLDTLCTGV